HAGQIWNGLLEERQKFAGQVKQQQRKPGQVAAGMRQTCDKSGANRVWHKDKHDGNCACDLLQRSGAKLGYSNGDINITFDELPCEDKIPVGLLGGKLVQEFDVLALGVTEIAERLDERREVLPLFFGAAGMPEHANSGDLPAWLCRRRERPRQCGGAKKRNELASPHVDLAVGWPRLIGILAASGRKGLANDSRRVERRVFSEHR